jgi:signal transduction histidine kinase
MDSRPGLAQNVDVTRLYWFVAATATAALAAAVAGALAAEPVDVSSIQFLLTVPVPFLAAGIFLLWRRPDHRVGQLLVVGTATSMAYAALLERVLIDRYARSGLEEWMSWALVLEAIVFPVGIVCIAQLIALFPSGKPSTPRLRTATRLTWWLPLPMTVALLSNESVLIEPMAFGQYPAFPNPIHIEALAALGPFTAEMRSIVSVAVLAAVPVLYMRYRRESHATRREIRWVLFGSGAALALGAVPFVVGPLVGVGTAAHDSFALAASSVALVIIPLSVVIGVEQPSWIDADAVIRKSFTYGVLSLGIFVVYGALAAGLGLAAGARLPIEVAIVVTAVLAFAFHPMKDHLQAVADRWVFGDRPSALEAITGLEQTAEREDSVEELAARLAELVRRGARLRWATVSIEPDVVSSSGGVSGDGEAVVPITRGGETLGEIRCGPKLTGNLGTHDTDLIEALAGQAGLLISNLRLAGRIVQAQEAERRRLERNIHDGAQQELVALVAKLGLARARARQGGVDESELFELQSDAQAILRDLRELAQGIHPSVLTDGGLVEAVEDRCSRLPIDVQVDTSADLRTRRFEDDIEGAAYFFVTEALANTMKHASATRARVAIRHRNGDLHLTVTDDGIGFAPDAIRQNGLAGLRDRFTALSGLVSVESQPGSGVVLRARLPTDRDPK